MKESAKAQHEVDKANFEAAKAEGNERATLAIYGTRLFGMPFGSSPMVPLLWAPIGLK